MSEGFENNSQLRRLGRGIVFSIAGVILAIIPGLGALLSLIGLFIVISTYVPQNRVRYPFAVLLSLICALISVGALCGMAYVYFGNPELKQMIILRVLQFLGAGPETIPGVLW